VENLAEQTTAKRLFNLPSRLFPFLNRSRLRRKNVADFPHRALVGGVWPRISLLFYLAEGFIGCTVTQKLEVLIPMGYFIMKPMEMICEDTICRMLVLVKKRPFSKRRISPQRRALPPHHKKSEFYALALNKKTYLCAIGKTESIC